MLRCTIAVFSKSLTPVSAGPVVPLADGAAMSLLRIHWQRLDIQKNGLMSLLFVRLAWYWWRGKLFSRSTTRLATSTVKKVLDPPFEHGCLDSMVEAMVPIKVALVISQVKMKEHYVSAVSQIAFNFGSTGQGK